MTRIDGTGSLAELLRRRLNALKNASATTPASTSGRTSTGARQAPRSTQGDRVDIAGTLTKRVQLISPDDPHRHRKAFRAFLEAMLLAELGESLINDPAFYQMVDHVQQQMEGDPQLAEAIEEASMILLSGKLD